MKILSARQLKEADQHTLQEQQITAADLITRAATAFADEFMRLFAATREVMIFCGPGNNGADALAVARILFKKDYHISVYVLNGSEKKIQPEGNLDKKNRFLPITYISHVRDLPIIAANKVVIDGLFGTGINRQIDGLAAELIQHINQSLATVVAIDVPSGLGADSANISSTIINADYTISFETPKLSFFLPGSDEFVGDWLVVSIGLDKQYMLSAESDYYAVTLRHVAAKLRPRKKFDHKGQFGTALLMAGSYGMMGAALLAARACLRSGVGKLRVQVPAAGNEIMQISVPDAMTLPDSDPHVLSQFPDLEMFTAIGIGPGIGKHEKTANLMRELLHQAKAPLVIDADAINIMAEHPDILDLLPHNSILTPHLKEFERLTGTSHNDFERLQKLQDFCRQRNCYVVLKGAYSCTCTPRGCCYFNTTGNPGMATGGSGDVLTGIITGLLAQQYSPHEAAVIGVYIHGLAGDFAKDQLGTYALTASDIVLNLGEAFLRVEEMHYKN